MAAAVSQESQRGSAGKGAANEAQPGDHADPANFAFDGREQNEDKRERTRERDRGAESPAHASDPADKKIGKPDGDRQRADVHEIAESQQIAGNRQVPGSFAEETLDRNERER